VAGSIRAPGLPDVLHGGGARVWHSVQAAGLDSVTRSVWNQVGLHVWQGVRRWLSGSNMDSFSRDSLCNLRDVGRLALCHYLHDVAGFTQAAGMVGLWELAQSAGGALPHQNICWVSERPNVLARDGLGRLHSLTGPACAYPDGFAIYSVHGVGVPAYVIDHPHLIDIAGIDDEENAEVRRVMIERYRHGEDVSGMAAFMHDAGGERLDHDERYGTLWRRSRIGEEPIVLIEVVNSTREPDGNFRRYWLRVPPNMTSAREAVAWTFDLSADQYAPTKES